MCTTLKTSKAKRSRWSREGFVMVYLSTFWCSEAGFLPLPSSVVVLDIDRTFHPSLPELVACWWRRSFGRTFIKNGACADGARYASRWQTTRLAWQSTRWLTNAFLVSSNANRTSTHRQFSLQRHTPQCNGSLWKRYQRRCCKNLYCVDVVGWLRAVIVVTIQYVVLIIKWVVHGPRLVSFSSSQSWSYGEKEVSGQRLIASKWWRQIIDDYHRFFSRCLDGRLEEELVCSRARPHWYPREWSKWRQWFLASANMTYYSAEIEIDGARSFNK